jgi:predicted Zn-dependent peptidase
MVTALALPVTAAPRAQRAAAPASPGLAVEEHVLDNGMRVLLVPRHITPTISLGWVAHVGSVNERPGITGMSHLFEHMMFKGTHVIGTRGIAKDLKLIDEQERVRDEMRAEESRMRAAARRGEIEDITSPESKTPRYRALEARFDSLVAEQRANMVKNEYDLILSKHGATVTNAFTAEDMTFYFDQIPANKLELWLWMEADRLKSPVFREFYSERDVVYEERRRSVESTPTGKFEESFDSVFWDSSPYSWPVLGWPSDVANITKEQADEYFSLYYAPQNLTAILVGDFDPKQAQELARKYLGTVPRGPRPAPEMITAEVPQLAEKRFYGEAETNPAVTIRWHVPALQHKDVPVLFVLQELLNGPTGRLQRNVVLGEGPATAAGARLDPRKYEGMFEIQGEAKDGRTPEQVEQAIHAEIGKLQEDVVSAEELQKVKNRYLAGAYRQLTNNFQIMLRLALADGRGEWRDADRIEKAVLAATAEDVKRVAGRYLTRENRAVAVWTRKAGTEPEDPALAALPAEAKPMVKALVTRIEGAKEPAQVQEIIGRLDQMAGQVPPEMKPAIEYVRSKAQARLAELNQ